jgi:hypothetical protein
MAPKKGRKMLPKTEATGDAEGKKQARRRPKDKTGETCAPVHARRSVTQHVVLGPKPAMEGCMAESRVLACTRITVVQHAGCAAAAQVAPPTWTSIIRLPSVTQFAEHVADGRSTSTGLVNALL